MARARLAIKRFDSAENKPPPTVCNTSGSTVVALTNQAAPSFQKLSTLCFAGTMMRVNAMCIYQTFQSVALLRTICSPSGYENQLFGKVDGLLGAGRFKSLLLRHQLNSSLWRASGSVIRNHWSDKFTR